MQDRSAFWSREWVTSFSLRHPAFGLVAALLATVDVFTFALALPAGLSPDGLAQIYVVLRGGCADDAADDRADHGTGSDASAGHAPDHGASGCANAGARERAVRL